MLVGVGASYSAVRGWQRRLRLALGTVFLSVCCLKSFSIGTRRTFLLSPYENEAFVSFVVWVEYD